MPGLHHPRRDIFALEPGFRVLKQGRGKTLEFRNVCPSTIFVVTPTTISSVFSELRILDDRRSESGSVSHARLEFPQRRSEVDLPAAKVVPMFPQLVAYVSGAQISIDKVFEKRPAPIDRPVQKVAVV